LPPLLLLLLLPLLLWLLLFEAVPQYPGSCSRLGNRGSVPGNSWSVSWKQLL
jgi:hypothetical protein